MLLDLDFESSNPFDVFENMFVKGSDQNLCGTQARTINRRHNVRYGFGCSKKG